MVEALVPMYKVGGVSPVGKIVNGDGMVKEPGQNLLDAAGCERMSQDGDG